MAKKLSVDLELNAQGYTQGINEAKGATAQYTNTTRDLKKETNEYLEQFGNLRKQFSTARKEAQNLAASFAQLSKTEKEGELGKYMKEQLDVAIQKAAELQDVMSDTSEAIKRTASDTQTWDALKDGLEIGKDLATAYAGAIAKLTGNEKALKDMVATVAMVQGAANAAVKIGNALQKQSNIMIALGNVQLKAKAIAEELATKKTVAATVAQRVFNSVAKANPYVLLATVAIAAATAIGGYMLATNKAVKETKKIDEELTGTKKTLNSVANSFNGNYAQALGKTLGTYKQLQNQYKALSSEHEKTKWIKENTNKLKDLGLSVKGVNDADRILIKQSKDVIESFKLRAQAAAEAARLQDLYVKRIEAETEARKKANKKQIKSGESVQQGDVDRFGLQEGIDYQQYKNKVGMFYTDAGAMKAQQALAANNIRTYTKEIDAEIEASANRLAEAEAKYDKTLGNLGLGDSGDSGGSKVVDKMLPKMPNVNAQINKWFKDFDKKIAADAEKMKLDMGSFIDLDGERVKTIVDEALNFGKGALTPKEPLDFSFLSESLQKEAETGMQKLDVLSNALVEAGKAKDKFSKEGNAEGVKQMEEQITSLTDAYNEQSDALDKLAEKSSTIGDLSKTFDLLGGEVGKVGNAFTMLGEALGSEGLQAFGIIAQTIANIMLSFSQALIQAAYLGPWAWIAFGIQGIAQVASLVSQIKNLSAGEYAEGGVIPGNSFSGDKLWAKVNSGERILTAKQNENLERIANGVGYYKETGLQTVSYVKLRGSDIILSIQNQEKLDHKKYLK